MVDLPLLLDSAVMAPLAALPTFEAVTAWLQTLDIWTVWATCFGVLLLCGFGLPIPEDISLVLCGYMTYLLVPADGSRGDPALHCALAIAVGMAGVLIGDATMFTLGAKFGGHLIGKWPFRSILGSGRKELASEFLQKKGPHVLFSARFMPGLRSVVFFTSGTLGIRMRTFLFYDGLAAVLSVPLLIGASWYFGAQIHNVIEQARRAEHGILAIILAIAAGAALKYWWGQRKKARDQSQGR